MKFPAWLLLCVVTFSGCTMFNLNDFSLSNADEPRTPSRMIPVWTDTVLTRAGQQGVRGFGCRLVFYEHGQQQPIRVDGAVVVYAWDDTDDASQNRPPDRKYVITAEELAAHYSASWVGPSYSLWIPWDAVGGEHRKVSLVTRYIGTNGAELTSQPMSAVLPGPIPERLAVSQKTLEPQVTKRADFVGDEAAAAASPIVQAGWETSEDDSPAISGPPRMTTTTLSVSPSFAARHFGDNSAPLYPDGHSVGGDSSWSSPVPGTEGSPGAAPTITAEAAGEGALAGREPSIRSERTPLPARIERPASPVVSPLRSRPRRSESPFHPAATPRPWNQIAPPESETQSSESATAAPVTAEQLLRSRQ